MPLLAFDSCARYHANYPLALAYTTAGSVETEAEGLVLPANTGFYNRTAWSGYDTVRVGIRFIYPEGVTGAMMVGRLLNSTTVIARLDVRADGRLAWYRSATSTADSVLVGLSDEPLTPGVPQTLDLYVRLATTAVGWLEVRQGPWLVIRQHNVATSSNTSATGFNPCYMGTTDTALRLRGFHVSGANAAELPGLGSAWTIDRVLPTGPGSATSWYANLDSLENWECVKDQGFTADDEYVASETVGAVELFQVASAALPGSTVAGISIAGLATVESTPRTYQLQARSGGVDALSAALGSFTAYTYRLDQFVRETDPQTSAAWTPAAVRAAHYGFQLAS